MCHWCVVELKLWSNYNYSYIAEGTHRLPCKRHTNQTKSQRKKKPTTTTATTTTTKREESFFAAPMCILYVHFHFVFSSFSSYIFLLHFFSHLLTVYVCDDKLQHNFNCIIPPMHYQYDCENTKYVFFVVVSLARSQTRIQLDFTTAMSARVQFVCCRVRKILQNFILLFCKLHSDRNLFTFSGRDLSVHMITEKIVEGRKPFFFLENKWHSRLCGRKKNWEEEKLKVNDFLRSFCQCT